MTQPIAEILLAGPRGFCAGVERAIDIVELALSVCRPPVYVAGRSSNRHVVESLRGKGAISSRRARRGAERRHRDLQRPGSRRRSARRALRRGLRVIDATCPLVTKVHLEAVRYAREGYTIVLIGHEDHDEVIGTLGEAPSGSFVIDSAREVDTLDVPTPTRSPT